VATVVAPHAGAWIETRHYQLIEKRKQSRPMRARGLKHSHILDDVATIKSRPMRARGLKLRSANT